MSRLGKHPVVIPSGVDVVVVNQAVKVKGKLGELSATFTNDVAIGISDNLVTVTPANKGKRSRSMWGTSRGIINNMVTGVSEGFKVELELQGVGYRASVAGGILTLQLGFSHDIEFPVPEGIKIECEKPTQVTVSGIDRRRVGQIAAEIRKFRKPEPYKGKGIRYVGEWIPRKEGKKK